MNKKIAVMGAGSFGTALADLNARAGRNVLLWAREQELVTSIMQQNENVKYLPGIPLTQMHVTADAKLALHQADIILFAIPTQYLRASLSVLAKDIPAQSILINLAKGIENTTLLTPAGIFSDVLGDQIIERYATISGPTFAKELILNMPTGAAIAASDKKLATYLQKTLSTHTFRLYSSHDIIGVELGGALKNVYAIGVGICDGLGYGNNTRAGLITRCLYEMSVLGNKMGADALTFSGLSGIGDLILTCTGDLSRNRQVGIKLGKGEKLTSIISSMKHVAEGVATTQSLHELTLKMGVDAPNALQVYEVLYENLSPRQSVENLLSRALKSEFKELT